MAGSVAMDVKFISLVLLWLLKVISSAIVQGFTALICRKSASDYRKVLARLPPRHGFNGQYYATIVQKMHRRCQAGI